MLPYLADRPLVLTRFPDGINGKSFFQKDAPAYAQAFVRTVHDLERRLTARAGLLRVRQRGVAALHREHGGDPAARLGQSRVATLETPDWCILDLDPKDAPFTDVVTVARAVQALCDDIGLPCGNQDERVHRTPRADPAGSPVHLRAVPHAGRSAGPGHRGAAPRHRHRDPPGAEARRKGVPRLRPERTRAPARGAVQRAPVAGARRSPRRSPGAR